MESSALLLKSSTTCLINIHMVFFYTLPPKAHARGFRVYMGRDKYENEELLKYGWKEDVWFHVEGISSAHVYLRLPEGVEWDAIPPVVMKFCSQLVKNTYIILYFFFLF